MRLRGDSIGKTDYCLCDNNYFTLVICGGKWEIIPLSLCLSSLSSSSFSKSLALSLSKSRVYHRNLNLSLTAEDKTHTFDSLNK